MIYVWESGFEFRMVLVETDCRPDSDVFRFNHVVRGMRGFSIFEMG